MTVKTDLQALKKQLKAMVAKIEKIEKAVGAAPKAKKAAPKKKKAAAKKATKKKAVTTTAKAKKGANGATAIETVVGIIRRSKNGADISTIKKRTDLTDKQISNILYKAKKKGSIKSLGKGIYGKS